MNKTSEGLGEFVIAGSEASCVLETIEATFDAIPQSVNRSVDFDLNTPIFLRGNDWRAAAPFDIGANGIRVVTDRRATLWEPTLLPPLTPRSL
jgi:hypothetical protein